MSYTAEFGRLIDETVTVAERPSGLSNPSANETTVESASAVELFSYAVCCAGQGLVWALYLVLIITVPAVISQGVSLTLPW